VGPLCHATRSETKWSALPVEERWTPAHRDTGPRGDELVAQMGVVVTTRSTFFAIS
jgi:hypothetical protein